MERRFIKTNYQALLIAQTKRTIDRKCNCAFFKVEADDEGGVWFACTVKEVSNDRLRDCFV